MKIQKGVILAGRKLGTDEFFANRHGCQLMLSAGVRDWILPNKNIQMEITDDGDLALTPTQDESEYKLNYRGSTGQSSVCVCAVSNLIEIPQKTRMSCVKIDGKILVKLRGSRK